MNTNYPCWLRRHSGLALSLILGTSSATFAQDVKEDEPIELSPFNVNADSDVGYLATQTLSGSRLNTSLRDTPATVHVFTQEFLEDIGAITLEDVMAYSNNAVKNNDDEDFFSGAFDIRAELNFRALVRGLPATRARNFFRWQLPSDGYVTERLDQSRGPNGTLFGLSGAGGVINQSTKQARLNRDFNTAQYRFGSNNLSRASLDVNKVLIKDKLAIRLNGMYHDSDHWRLYNWERKQGIYGAVTYQAFENTTIRASFENFRKRDSVTGSVGTSLKTIDTWDALGRPLFDFANGPIPRNPELFANGLQRNSAANARVTIFDQDAGPLANQVFDLRGFAYTRNRIPNGNGFKTWDFLYPQDEFPSNIAVEGPGTSRSLEFDDFVLSVDQKLAENLYLNVGYNRTDYNWDALELRGTTVLTPGNGSIQGDPNASLPDGSPNPYAGSLFVDLASRRPINEKLIETFRAALSYEFDFTEKSEGWARHLGHHRFAASYEDYEEDANGRVLSEIWIDQATQAPAYFSGRPNHVRNRVFRRHYINNEGDFTDYHNADRSVTPTSIVDPTNPSRTIAPEFKMDLFTPADLIQSLQSQIVALQSHFLNNRFVTTVGWRNEEGTTKKFNYVLNDLKNEYSPIGSNDFIYDKYTGGNKSVGGVFHATRNLSFFYNTSSSIDLPDNDARVIPGEFPDPGKGEGADFGVNVTLLDGQISLKALRFDTAQRRVTVSKGAPGQIYGRNERVLDALSSQGFIDAATEAQHRLTDRINRVYIDKESTGYEFSVTANLIKNLRLVFNYSLTDKDQANAGNAAKVWAAAESAFWLNSIGSNDPDTVILDNNNSIQDEIDNLEQWTTQTLRPGTPVGLRRQNLNFFANYTFNDGMLKGFAFGGGYRYLGKNLMAYLADDSRLHGEGYGMADLMMRYRMKLNDKRTLTFQMNVKNLFDKDDYIPGRYLDNDPANPLQRVYILAPREFQFTTTLAF